MFKTSTKKGMSLVEVLINMAILAITLPIIYRSLIFTQQFFNASNSEAEMSIENNMMMQKIYKDIKESVVIYDNSSVKDDFKNTILFDSVVGTKFTESNGNLSSAILLMKYLEDEKINIDSKELNLSKFKLICYYMTLKEPNNPNSFRNIIRMESKETFINPTPLNESERNFLLSNNYNFWIPPQKGFKPNLPTKITPIKFKLSSNVAYGNIRTNDFISPSTGGLVFSKKENLVKVSLSLAQKTSKGLAKDLQEKEISIFN